MGAISLDDVTKVYDPVGEAVVAVEDLDIDIKDGEFLVLVGPSGCGKSTTLRMVAGLESITDGTVSIGGGVVNDAPPKERNIAMVFQNYALYPHMTVRENIGFGLKYSSDLEKADRRERAEEAAEMMGIEELLDDTPDQLSGGQQQRVALGRAIVREPEAFLFDEPLSNLDAKLRTRMRTEIARLQRELGVTSIYVTHDQAEAMTMGDRIAVMNEGELQQIGVPNEVYKHPENRFVAGFIGSPRMNFIEATLDSRAGSSVLVDRAGNGECLHYEVTESIRDGPDLEPGDDVTVGVRPEDLHVSTGEVDDDTGSCRRPSTSWNRWAVTTSSPSTSAIKSGSRGSTRRSVRRAGHLSPHRSIPTRSTCSRRTAGRSSPRGSTRSRSTIPSRRRRRCEATTGAFRNPK